MDIAHSCFRDHRIARVTPVEYYSLRSSLVRNVLYNQETGNLDLFLVNGGVRRFSSVPDNIVRNLIRSKSPGRYYLRAIRGKYPSR